jgi:hypothetical protein
MHKIASPCGERAVRRVQRAGSGRTLTAGRPRCPDVARHTRCAGRLRLWAAPPEEYLATPRSTTFMSSSRRESRRGQDGSGENNAEEDAGPFGLVNSVFVATLPPPRQAALPHVRTSWPRGPVPLLKRPGPRCRCERSRGGDPWRDHGAARRFWAALPAFAPHDGCTPAARPDGTTRAQMRVPHAHTPLSRKRAPRRRPAAEILATPPHPRLPQVRLWLAPERRRGTPLTCLRRPRL